MFDRALLMADLAIGSGACIRPHATTISEHQCNLDTKELETSHFGSRVERMLVRSHFLVSMVKLRTFAGLLALVWLVQSVDMPEGCSLRSMPTTTDECDNLLQTTSAISSQQLCRLLVLGWLYTRSRNEVLYLFPSPSSFTTTCVERIQS